MERHDLIHEFPEHQEKIAQLKASDAHFNELFEEYHKVEEEVNRINTGEAVVIDEFAHTLKAKLLHLKDEIYSHLNK
ncbi:YdcH family protein [Flavobacterium aciduliphilum]|jgi:uncharacterized protein YdcH (DUF465 family)|uniref:GTP-binding protein n=1 Tax=Flavobacterium aciduliphilum TaxID=1101402 RepID=A0A328Y954_9FLAO|nr:DUF465 domain-containing protein [Flavobacterium aciduliphilum]RAR70130.1 hypothetical protein CLV55_11242 [Flavobacterium aciduliphilum]